MSFVPHAVEAIHKQLEEARRNMKYPEAFRNVPSETILSVLFNHKPRFDPVPRIHEWTKSIQDKDWYAGEGEDDLEILPLWSTCRNCAESGRRMPLTIFTEVVRLSLAKVDDVASVFIEDEIVLPSPPGAEVKISTFQADLIIGKPLPDSLSNYFLQATDARLFQPEQRVNDKPHFFLGTFFVAWGPVRTESLDAACRHAALNVLGIQNQRKLLGLTNRPVYGLVVLENAFHLAVSYWTDFGKMEFLYATRESDYTWDALDPVKIVECLQFLRSLKTYINEGFNQDVAELESKRP